MSHEIKTPLLAADCVLIRGAAVLLIKRRNAPFQGTYALPGGFVEEGETVEEACKREMREETGIEISNLKLIGVYSDPRRDPRRHVVSIAFLATCDAAAVPKAGDDAAEAHFVSDWKDVPLAFDHFKILSDAEALRGFSKKNTAGI